MLSSTSASVSNRQFNLQKSSLILYSITILVSSLGNFAGLLALEALSITMAVIILTNTIITIIIIILTKKNYNVNILGTIQATDQILTVLTFFLFGGVPAGYAVISALFLWLFFALSMSSIIITNSVNFSTVFLLAASTAGIILLVENPFNIPVQSILKDTAILEPIFAGNFLILILIFFGISNRYNRQHESQKAIRQLYHQIDEKNKYLIQTQDELINKEKMAALGGLVAGIGHEINTPLSVINGAINNVQPSIDFVTQNLIHDLNKIPADLESKLKSILEHAVTYLNSGDELSTQQERRYRRKIAQELKSYGVEDSNYLARQLVRIGLFSDLEPYKSVFQHEKISELLLIIDKLTNILLNSNHIQNAAKRIQKITAALKNYSYQKEAQAMIPCNLEHNIDTILTLYNNQLKRGITVNQNFENDIPSIMAFPDQLDQVWANLMQNAIQAMNYEGSLDLKMYQKEQFVVVEFIDSGPGIPAEIRSKIFQPFFTTKQQGEGSGLGLDICSKIIEKHHGNIEVESEPGRTCFRVQLPININGMPAK